MKQVKIISLILGIFGLYLALFVFTAGETKNALAKNYCEASLSTNSTDYLDPTSPDFDPTKAGHKNPKIDQGVPPCCSHPYYHSVWRANSKDGKTWTKENKKLIDHASVPDMQIVNDKEIVYYVDGKYDTMNCRIKENGKLKPGKCRIYNFSGKKAWDPEVVKVDDYYRMYFMSPPSAFSTASETSKIKTAVSRDGINWLEEDSTALKGKMYIDPTVMKVGDKWIMVVSGDNEGLFWATSTNGTTFKLKGKLKGSAQDGASPHITKLSKKYALYYCKAGISMSLSKNAEKWSGERSILSSEQNQIICDPSVTRKNNGKYVMYYKVQEMTLPTM
ncbi:MAG: hypothetical protein WC663_00230 [Patescibacteria group bacterium]|jgi:predicted GH43/DUF377 family glycosyl hydrolase